MPQRTSDATFSFAPTPRTAQTLLDDENRLHLRWLLRLRWGSLASHVALTATVSAFTAVRPPLWPFVLVLALEVAANFLLLRMQKKLHKIPVGILVAAIAGDILLLTALLAMTGGPLNPFTFLYLIYVAIASVSLPMRWTWGLTILAALSYGFLFASSGFMPEHDHAHMLLHLQGMWFAFAIAALFIAFFVGQLRSAIAQRSHDAAALQTLQMQNEKLSALAQLAGGAAHEFATPLSTIAVIVDDMKERLTDPEWKDDVDTLLQEIARCRTILRQLSADGGEVLGEQAKPHTPQALIDEALDGLHIAQGIHVEISMDAQTRQIIVPYRAVGQALRGIIKNAVEASLFAGKTAAHVCVSSEVLCNQETHKKLMLAFVVRDSGGGMEESILKRACEPFMTTKAPGKGMGLGLFLARTLVDRCGGLFLLQNETTEKGTGLVVKMMFPILSVS